MYLGLLLQKAGYKAGVMVSAWIAGQFNVVNNIIGSGLLSLPWTMQQCGLFAGLVVMFGMCCLNGT